MSPIIPYDFSKTNYLLFQIPPDETTMFYKWFDVTEMDVCLRLPRTVRPKGLSLWCTETVLHPIEVPNGLLETRIQNLKGFCQEIREILLMIINCKCARGSDIKQDHVHVDDFVTSAVNLIDNISVQSVKGLKSIITLTLCSPPVEIGCIEADFVYQNTSHPKLYVENNSEPISDTWKDMAQTFCIELARTSNADLTSYFKYASSLSECLKIDSERALRALAKEYKADIQEIQSKQKVLKPKFIVGESIPNDLLEILDQDISLIFRPQEWVGYEIRPGVFIYAIIQHPILVDHDDLTDLNPLEARYQILIKEVVELDGDITLVVASVLDLYKFVQESNVISDESTALVPSDETSPSNQLRNASDSIKLLQLKRKICAELKLVWRLHETKEERSKAIRRMYMQYHPDKCNPKDARLYEDAFKYLIRQLDRLEKGLPLEEPTDIETEEPEAQASPFCDLLRQCDQYVRRRSRAVPVITPSTIPIVFCCHEEAMRWLRQAECDFEAMETLKSTIGNKPGASCQVLFLAHEVAEKALKGGMYELTGLNPGSLTHHYLQCHARAIASERPHEAGSIPDLISGLEKYYIHSRFPNAPHPLYKAPVDVYKLQPELAVSVAENVGEVLKIIQNIINSGSY